MLVRLDKNLLPFEEIRDCSNETIETIDLLEMHNLGFGVYSALANLFCYRLRMVVNGWASPKDIEKYYTNGNKFAVFSMGTEVKTADHDIKINHAMRHVGHHIKFTPEEIESHSEGLEQALVAITKFMKHKDIKISDVCSLAYPDMGLDVTTDDSYKYHRAWYRIDAYHHGERVIEKKGNLIYHSFLEVWRNILKTYGESDGSEWFIMICLVDFNTSEKSEKPITKKFHKPKFTKKSNKKNKKRAQK